MGPPMKAYPLSHQQLCKATTARARSSPLFHGGLRADGDPGRVDLAAPVVPAGAALAEGEVELETGEVVRFGEAHMLPRAPAQRFAGAKRRRSVLGEADEVLGVQVRG